MTEKKLTPKRRQVLELTQDPEIGLNTQKIAAAMNISRNGAAGHLRGLRDDGFLNGAPPPRRGRPRKSPALRGRPSTPNGAVRETVTAERVRETVNAERESFKVATMKRRDEVIAAIEFHRDLQMKHAGEASELEEVQKELDQVLSAV